jgi:hypothetical protein
VRAHMRRFNFLERSTSAAEPVDRLDSSEILD